MAYVYEDHGYRSQSTYPAGRVIAHLPDAFGRARQAGAYASGIAYHPNDVLSALAYANGQNLSVTLNSRRMPQRYLSTKGATVALDLTYSYDTSRNVTQITDAVSAANNRTLGYDGINRLTSATGPWGGGSVAYDPLGNIRQYVTGAWALTLNYNASTNRLSSTSGSQSASYAYDARGNITGNGFQTFTFDRANEITAVNGTLAAYRYDAHGKRVRTISGGSTVYSIYGAGGVLLHKDNATTGARTDYVYAGAQLVAEVGTTPVYIHSDQLGSPVAGTDAAGAVAWTERYAPYGDQLLAPPATQDNVAYSGHHSDAVTGLIYMEARYYDPLIGRFYSNDPVGFTDDNPVSFNRYAYANNNPYAFVDPNGAQACTAISNCFEATNYRSAKAGNQTVVQSANIDAAAISNLPLHESMGNVENAVRFDEHASGNVTTTSVPTTSVVKGNTIESTISGIRGADAIGHSHPIDTSDPSPGPRDDRAVNSEMPNNIVHDGNVLVVEKVSGQFRARVLNDANLTRRDERNIQRDVNKFQKREQP